MVYTITAPSLIQTSIRLPASKSISNRALILNELSESPYPIENLSDSDDTKVLQKALKSKTGCIDIEAAGTSMRFLTAYLSQLPGKYTITGTERMKNRPIETLVEALRSLGAVIEYMEKEGYPPLRIQGKKMKGGDIHLDGSISSQYISALMMIAPYMEKGLNLYLEGDLISSPYIWMTKCLMEDFGASIEWQNSVIRIKPQPYKAIPIKIENDWSAASYWYEIKALCETEASIELLGLETNSIQGDSKVADIFARLNARQGVFQCDFVDIPDLAPTLVVTCCLLNIPFCFTGLQSLRIKETDRISALQEEMKKLGYLLKNESDSAIKWQGEKCQENPEPIISTHNDHRIAMSFAPVCLKRKNIKILSPEVVSKSYPLFWDDLKQAGFIIQIDKR